MRVSGDQAEDAAAVAGAPEPEWVRRKRRAILLGELLPERAVAGSHVSFPAWTLRAYDPRWGKDTILADILGGGTGARRDGDGEHALDTYTSNCAVLPTEIAELEYPWRVECTELVDGSGGDPGRGVGFGGFELPECPS